MHVSNGELTTKAGIVAARQNGMDLRIEGGYKLGRRHVPFSFIESNRKFFDISHV